MSIAPDGSPVDLYKCLAHNGEADIVHAAMRPGGTVLELGAGAGRVTHPLLQLGHTVTAVDNSPEMLAEIAGAETILADIVTLRLGRRFDAVVLGSVLLNVGDDALRNAFLQTCAAHVARDGVALFECHTSGLIQRAAPGLIVTDPDGLTVSWLDDVRVDGRTVSGTLEYRIGERVWTQSFSAHFLDQPEIERALLLAGLRFERWLTDGKGWFAATPL